MSKQPNKVSVEKGNSTKPDSQPGRSAEARADEARMKATMAVSRQNELAHMFAMAILGSPRVDTYLYGDPLRGGKCNGHDSVGAFLANSVFNLAREYNAEMTRLIESEVKKLCADVQQAPPVETSNDAAAPEPDTTAAPSAEPTSETASEAKAETIQ